MSGTVCDVSELKNKGEITDIERSVKHSSGKKRFVLINARSVDINGGTVLYVMRDITERKCAETALLKSEFELRRTLDATSDGIWTWNFETNGLYFSPKYYTMLGYEPNAFPADFENWIDLIHPDDREKALAVAEEYLRTKPDFYENEFQLRTKNGDYRWIRTRARVVERDENGEAIYMIGNHEDITERKQAEEALRLHEAQLAEYNQILEGILQYTHVMAVFLDPQFNFIWVNRAYAETCRQEQSFFRGKNHFDLYPHEENQKIFQQVVDTGKPFFVEAKPFEFPDQPERGLTYWDWSLIPVKDDLGKISGLVFTLAEVTDRIRAEKALQESEERYRLLTSLSPAGIYQTDEKGDCIYTNEAWQRMTGLSNDQALGQGWQKGLHPNDKSSIGEAWYKMVESNGHWGHEYRFQTAEGETTWVYGLAAPIFDGYGNASGYLGVNIDITDRKTAEDALKKAISREMEIVKEANVGLWDWDLITNKVRYSTVWKHQIGYDDHEIGDGFEEWQNRVHPEDLDPTIEQIQRCIKECQQDHRVEFRFRHKNGSYRYIMAQASILQDESGSPVRMRGSHIDITDRKLAEKALRESEERYRKPGRTFTGSRVRSPGR